MAIATKDRSVADAIEKARQYVTGFSDPFRTMASEDLESSIENWELFYGKPLSEEENPESALLAVIPADLEEMCDGDIPVTRDAVGQRFQVLALEVRTLKEKNEKTDALIACLDRIDRIEERLKDAIARLEERQARAES